MNQTEIDFTKTWWRSVLESPAKVMALMQNWEFTHRDSYDNWNRWIRYYCSSVEGKRHRDPFTTMRQRDLKSSEDYFVMFSRYTVNRKSRNTAVYSPYLGDIKAIAVSIDEVLATVLLTKTLVLERLRVLVDMPETPAELWAIFQAQIPGTEETIKYCTQHVNSTALDRVFPIHAQYVDKFFKREPGQVEVVKPEIATPVQVQEAVPPPTQRVVDVSSSSGDKFTVRVDLNPYGVIVNNPMSIVNITNIA